MDFKLTSAGLAATFAASNAGPDIEIREFRVGSQAGYQPGVLDTSLHGEELFRGTPIGYRVLDADTCEFTLYMSESVGTFDFGEIGLYLSTGELFALGVLPQVQYKIAQPDAGANRFNIRVRLNISGVQPIITYNVLDLHAAALVELPSVENLNGPAFMDANAYLCHSTDEAGNHSMVTRSDDRWTVHTHLPRVCLDAVNTIDAHGGRTLTAAGIVVPDVVVPGRYLIQFLTGSCRGQIRKITSLVAGRASWSNPISGVSVGDQFEILQSVVSLRSDGADAAFFFALLGK